MMQFHYLATNIFHNSLFFKGANDKIYILILLHHAVATCLSIGSDHSKLRNCNDMQNVFENGGIIGAQFLYTRGYFTVFLSNKSKATC